VEYFIKDPNFYKGKRVVISGGGDSALDWTIFLADGVAAEVAMVHRRTSFRGHLDSVQKVMDMAAAGKIKLYTDAEIMSLEGDGKLEAVNIETPQGMVRHEVDHWMPLFGLSPKLGPIADWGLNISKNSIEVDTFDYSTNIPGIYAIGDVNTYPGKLKLILCGFHEGTLMVQSAFKRIYPDKNYVLKYTTVNGVNGF
jgi:thioredoxin reductase (NADPH)